MPEMKTYCTIVKSKAYVEGSMEVETRVRETLHTHPTLSFRTESVVTVEETQADIVLARKVGIFLREYDFAARCSQCGRGTWLKGRDLEVAVRNALMPFGIVSEVTLEAAVKAYIKGA